MSNESIKIPEKCQKKPNAEDHPQYMDVSAVIAARKKEVLLIKAAMNNSTYTTKRAFQRLPRYLRRRTMSFNYHRLPHRARIQVRSEMREELLEKRRKRRSNWKRLRQISHSKRKEKVWWLETHVWHAKRFQMDTIQSVRFPVKRSDKAARSCRKFLKTNCIIHDMSYYFPVEVRGPSIDSLLWVLRRHTSEVGYKKACARQVVSGMLYGVLDIHRYDSDQLIAPATILFGRGNGDSKIGISLWIWAHFLAYDELLEALRESEGSYNSLRGDSLETIERSAEVYTEMKNEEKVVVYGRMGEILRFEVRGEKVHELLRNVFRISTASAEELSEQAINGEYKEWCDLANGFDTSAGLTNRSVFSFDIVDPSTFFPNSRKEGDFAGRKRRPCKENLLSILKDRLNKPENTFLESDLMDERFRSGMDFNPNGMDCNVEGGSHSMLPLVPVVLMQYPGYSGSGIGSGYDILIPKGYGMKVWISLIYGNCKAIGVEERRELNLEGFIRTFPFDYPGTNSFNLIAKLKCDREAAIYMRKPRAKRVNYSKLDVVAPFAPDFSQFFSDTAIVPKVHRFCVPSSKWRGEWPIYVNFDGDFAGSASKDVLLPVRIEMIGRSCPYESAMISLLIKKDVNTLQKELRDGKIHSIAEEGKNKSSRSKRKVIGLVTSGGYFLNRGRGAGIGFCTLEGARELLHTSQYSKDVQDGTKFRKKLSVLIRNTTSRKYFPARVSLLNDCYA